MTTLFDPTTLDPLCTQRLPYHFARRHGVISARECDDMLEIWARPGVAGMVLAELQRVLGRPIVLRELNDGEFNQALEIVDGLDDNPDLSDLASSLPQVADLLESEDDAPIVRLLNALFSQAVRDGASDIHVEPFETRSAVRFRIDGQLRDVIDTPPAAHGVIVSRVKIMARLDIAEKRLPQDGRITLRLGGRAVDVRVSTLPTAHGERVVMRLLDKQAARLNLTALGMADGTLARFDGLLHQPHGIILVTGPTGSGKTTTLYAALSQLDTARYNIMTVEDPIEFDLEGIGQTQVNGKIELSFARALRAILRQDPDIIMIGEIRDLETAQIAVQASLTGHLVLATLHTNDAAGAVTRLVDMGVEPYLLASSLLGVLAQRLLRKLCPHCRVAHAPDPAEHQMLGLDNFATNTITLYAPAGCDQCRQSGYQGRSGIFELLIVDEPLRRLIHDSAGDDRLREHARAQGMISLREDGLRWVRTGETSLAEVLRSSRE